MVHESRSPGRQQRTGQSGQLLLYGQRGGEGYETGCRMVGKGGPAGRRRFPVQSGAVPVFRKWRGAGLRTGSHVVCQGGKAGICPRAV